MRRQSTPSRKTAGVAVQTVFANFGSKRVVLGELLRAAQQAPAAAELRARLHATDNPSARVRPAVAIARRVYEQMTAGLDLLPGAAVVAPELATVERYIEERRRDGVARLVEHLADRGQLRADLTPADAGNLAWAITGADVYLVLEQGWTGDTYEHLLGDTLVAALLAPLERAGVPTTPSDQ